MEYPDRPAPAQSIGARAPGRYPHPGGEPPAAHYIRTAAATAAPRAAPSAYSVGFLADLDRRRILGTLALARRYGFDAVGETCDGACDLNRPRQHFVAAT